MASFYQRVEIADRSSDAVHRITRPADLADALHQASQIAEAKALLSKTEAM